MIHPSNLNCSGMLLKHVFQEYTLSMPSTYDECHRQLDEQNLYPSMFILDLYGREGIQEDVCIPRKELLEARLDKIPSLNVAYDSLEKYNYDREFTGK